MARIAILLPDLRPGGAESMRLRMAARWLKQGHEVEFVLREVAGQLLESLPHNASVVDLAAPRVRNALMPLACYLRISRPDALLAAMWPLTVIAPLAACGAAFKGRVVISEHAPQSLSYARQGRVHNAFMAYSMRVGYRMATARVGVSSGVVADMAALSGMALARFNVIHNPAATGQVESAGCAQAALLAGRCGPVILSVGTLKAVKRHDLLIRAFARMSRTDATLCIVGEGDERPVLEALIVSLGLEERILLAGYQAVTAAWYAHADLFVLASDYEGFGNVIVEALEHGLPVVSTNCPTGPHEILEDGKYGTLVPVGDVDALARAMDEALSASHDREQLKRRARDFSVDKAADAYLDLLLPGWQERTAA